MLLQSSDVFTFGKPKSGDEHLEIKIDKFSQTSVFNWGECHWVMPFFIHLFLIRIISRPLNMHNKMHTGTSLSVKFTMVRNFNSL